MLLGSCARVGQPQGGPVDRSGPELRTVEPPSGTRNIRPDQVVFTFNEFLAATIPNTAVFMAPLPPEPPVVQSRGKKLKVKLPEGLRDSTTYTLSLNSAVVDFNANNGLASPITVAFSTGSELDSAQVQGLLRNAYSGTPLNGWAVGLFPLPGDSAPPTPLPPDTVPLYLTETDSGGQYRLPYLAPGRYHLAGWKDQDRNRRWSGAEAVAVTDAPLVQLQNRTDLLERDLLAFQPDTQAPKLLRARLQQLRAWPDSASRQQGLVLHLAFSEPLLELDCPEARQLLPQVESDSLWRLLVPHALAAQARDPNKQAAPKQATPTRAADSLAGAANDSARQPPGLHLSWCDTLGNRRDSVLPLNRLRSEAPEQPTFLPWPGARPYNRYSWQAPQPLDTHWVDSLLRITDTTNNRALPGLQAQGLLLSWRLPDSLPKRKPLLVVDSALAQLLAPNTDTSLFLGLPELTPLEDLGAIRGRLVDSLPDSLAPGRKPDTLQAPGPWVVELLGPALARPRRSTGLRFNFGLLPEGVYRLQLVEDRDGNGRWSPGKVQNGQYTPPERLFRYGAELRLRPGWVLDNIWFAPALPETTEPIPSDGPAD